MLAARQHGVVALWQLYVLGVSRNAVRRRVESGRLHRVRRAVYAVGHPRLTPRGTFMAAVLAFGPDALLSHRSNAALRGLLPDARAVIDVTVPGRSRGGAPGVRLHLPRSLHPDDVDRWDGIPCTSVPRMLLEVAATEPARRLERIFEATERERQLDLRAVHRALERHPRHAGRKPVAVLLEHFRDPPPTIRSEAERRLYYELTNARLPRPALNVTVEGEEVDMLWADERVIVEVDGRQFHGTRAAFERDRARDVKLRLAGYTVLRFTWRQIAGDPARVVAAIAQALGSPLASAA